MENGDKLPKGKIALLLLLYCRPVIPFFLHSFCCLESPPQEVAVSSVLLQYQVDAGVRIHVQKKEQLQQHHHQPRQKQFSRSQCQPSLGPHWHSSSLVLLQNIEFMYLLFLSTTANVLLLLLLLVFHLFFHFHTHSKCYRKRRSPNARSCMCVCVCPARVE